MFNSQMRISYYDQKKKKKMVDYLIDVNFMSRYYVQFLIYIIAVLRKSNTPGNIQPW